MEWAGVRGQQGTALESPSLAWVPGQIKTPQNSQQETHSLLFKKGLCSKAEHYPKCAICSLSSVTPGAGAGGSQAPSGSACS